MKNISIIILLCIFSFSVLTVLGADKVASLDSTEWELGMVFKLPEQNRAGKYPHFLKVVNVLDENMMVIAGFKTGPRGWIGWLDSFILKTPTKGWIEGKEIKLDKKYKVIDTKKVRRDTLFIIEEVKDQAEE